MTALAGWEVPAWYAVLVVVWLLLTGLWAVLEAHRLAVRGEPANAAPETRLRALVQQLRERADEERERRQRTGDGNHYDHMGGRVAALESCADQPEGVLDDDR